MNKIYTFIFALLIVAPSASFAQCPGCSVNTSYTSPGIYPNPLPDGTQGQPYDQDVTFVMFTDTSGFTVNTFHITSVSGLPFGLNWECSNAAAGCVYDPSQSIYGCVKICGLPLQPGSYTILVNVDVDLQVVGVQQSTISIPVIIVAASGGNSGFNYGPVAGCDSLTTSFTALITGPGMASYSWDFGDFNTSTDPNPQHQYTSPGLYMPTLQTTLSEFGITDVNVASVNDNWCGDVEEPSLPFVGCQGSPDLYFELTDASGNPVYGSGTVDDVNSNTWSGLTITLQNPPYSISIWDEDPVSVNDNLGTFSFSPSGTGNINLSGAGGTTINITIGLQPVATFNDTDTVWVHASPVSPTVSVFNNDTICSDDFAVLTIDADSSLNYQWLESGIPVGFDDSLTVISGGNLNVVATDVYGCFASSDTVTIYQIPAVPNVNFLISGNTLTTFLTGYSLQWYQDSAAINGETQSTYIISADGDYYLMACDDFGCCRSSDTFFVVHTGITIHELSDGHIYFNSHSQELIVNMPNGTQFGLVDALGREVMRMKGTGKNDLVDLTSLPAGLYTVYGATDKGLVTKRISIIR